MEEKLKRSSFTRLDSKKLMGDSMKSCATTAAKNHRKKKSSDALFEIPTTYVMDVPIEGSVHEGVGEVSKEKTEKQMNMATKGKSKWKSKTYVANKVDFKNEKGKDLQKRREPSKIKRDISPYVHQKSSPIIGPTRNQDNHVVNMKTIISNICLHILLGGMVFDLDIIHKPGMDTLYDLVEIQSLSHLF